MPRTVTKTRDTAKSGGRLGLRGYRGTVESRSRRPEEHNSQEWQCWAPNRVVLREREATVPVPDSKVQRGYRVRMTLFLLAVSLALVVLACAYQAGQTLKVLEVVERERSQLLPRAVLKRTPPGTAPRAGWSSSIEALCRARNPVKWQRPGDRPDNHLRWFICGRETVTSPRTVWSSSLENTRTSIWPQACGMTLPTPRFFLRERSQEGQRGGPGGRPETELAPISNGRDPSVN